MNTKKLLSIAIIVALPFGATADYTYVSQNTPAPVANNGTVTRAYNGPYQTITPGADDDKHIASTKYVIGAYNDTIAAVNKMHFNLETIASFLDEKSELRITDENDIDTPIENYVEQNLSDVTEDNQLVTGMAVKNALNAQRVTIYTTWEDDTENGTTQVELSTAQ